MIVLHTQNVGTALNWGIEQFQQMEQVKSNIIAPRGMRTVEAPQPVTTVYTHPTERVLFSPTRDANPFFHFFESLWMLAGRNDAAFVSRFVKRMSTFSDDGDVLHGAYGFRWREWFGFDQLHEIVKLLKADPDSRRAVLTMWSPVGDLVAADGGVGGIQGKDVPCNTQIFFKIRAGRRGFTPEKPVLHMTVCNRSNDMIWGAYGANAVHMSMLQEYVANKLGVEVGVMRQVSDSLHVYLDGPGGELWAKLKEARFTRPTEFLTDPYCVPSMKPFPLGAETFDWDADLDLFMQLMSAEHEVRAGMFSTPFFQKVVVPLWRGWVGRSVVELESCEAPDWRKATLEWVSRRDNGMAVPVR